MMQKLLIITPYPPRGTTYGNKFSALASFAKNKIDALRKLKKDLKITVLADIIPNSFSWKEENFEVRRLWKRNDWTVYFFLLLETLKESNADKIFIEIEWALLGNSPFILGILPLFIGLLRLLGKKVVVVAHGVILDFLSLAPQLGWEKRITIIRLYDLGIYLFYKLLIFFSTNIIVTEKYFADLLNSKYKSDKVIFIPHGVDTNLKKMPLQTTRKRLGLEESEFLITSFGFLSWYKGSDVLARLFLNYVSNNPEEKVRLFLAGGSSFLHKEKEAHKGFIEQLKELIKQTQKITITGFLPEDKIRLYYSASDLIVIPYRKFISSSGPLSLAFSFEKPVLISKNLIRYFDSKDMISSLKTAQLKQEDIVFNLNEKGFEKKLNWARNKKNLEKLRIFSALMKEKRSWINVTKKYLKIWNS